ncbi:MAG: PIN domain-containing protein [Myxococcales bacterium]|nr:PIN domain-containing protein [Myxococcales bacterium]
MIWLLDGNVLVALTLSTHLHHRAAHAWFRAKKRAFATCASTEGTLLRVLMGPHAELSAAEAWGLLAHIRHLDGHVFWPDSLSYAEVPTKGILGHRQVTDAFLAQLARVKDGKVATFDSGFHRLQPDATELVPV